MDFETAQLLTEEHRSAQLPTYVPYVPASTVQPVEEQEQHFNLPTVMSYSPVSSDSFDEPSSDGQLEEMQRRKNVLKILISVTCR